MTSAARYHDFSAGHRVYGHENKCAHLHGHNYRVHFIVRSASLDKVGRVLDFSVIRAKLCDWLEKNWDHKFLVFEGDPWVSILQGMDPDGVVVVPFNPTAELMAEYLVKQIGPKQLKGTNCQLTGVIVEETRKCSAVAEEG